MIAQLSVAVAELFLLLPSFAAEQQPDPKATEVWAPEPERVTPGSPASAPSDAIVLFDGKDLREWVSAAAPDQPAGWTVAGGSFTVRGGSGRRGKDQGEQHAAARGDLADAHAASREDSAGRYRVPPSRSRPVARVPT